MTGDFCASCHVMQPVKVAYIKDVHNNNLGTKAYNGFKELSITALAKDINWQDKLEHKKDYVYDSGCMSCHQDITKVNSKNEMQNIMHKRYLDYANELKCVSCNTCVGHDGLRGELKK